MSYSFIITNFGILLLTIFEGSPISGSMNIRKVDARFDEYANDILDRCPVGKTPQFQDGYLEFVLIFTEDLKSFFGLVDNDDGTCYVDLEYSLENTEMIIQYESSELSDTEQCDYLRGALVAEKNILDVYLFNLKNSTKKNAA